MSEFGCFGGSASLIIERLKQRTFLCGIIIQPISVHFHTLPSFSS